MEFNPLKILKKRETNKVGAAALSLAIAISAACEKRENKNPLAEDLKNKDVAEKTVKITSPEIAINIPSTKITREEFESLVNHIQSNGKLHSDTGVPLKQLSFSTGQNRHSYIYRLNSDVVRDVVFTKDGIFVYVINKDMIRPNINENGEYKDSKSASKEIKQFLDKINR